MALERSASVVLPRGLPPRRRLRRTTTTTSKSSPGVIVVSSPSACFSPQSHFAPPDRLMSSDSFRSQISEGCSERVAHLRTAKSTALYEFACTKRFLVGGWLKLFVCYVFFVECPCESRFIPEQNSKIPTLYGLLASALT